MNENKTAITEFVEWLENVNIYGDISYPEMWGEVMDKARALEASQAEKDKGLWEMLYKKLYPYPCGESNNRVRLDGSSLDIWFTKDEVDLIISRHQSNPIDPDYAESKAWKEKMGKMIGELEAWSNDCMDGPEFPLRGCPGMIKFTEIVAKYKGGK